MAPLIVSLLGGGLIFGWAAWRMLSAIYAEALGEQAETRWLQIATRCAVPLALAGWFTFFAVSVLVIAGAADQPSEATGQLYLWKQRGDLFIRRDEFALLSGLRTAAFVLIFPAAILAMIEGSLMRNWPRRPRTEA